MVRCTVARIVADYANDPGSSPHAAWIAEADGVRAGCVFCVPADEASAQLRILLVDPQVRGQGLGRLLVDACLAFARDAGYKRVWLWTNDVLHAARKIYLDAGFVCTNEEPHHSFGVDLVGQTYEKDLH
jgi:GNAT superfamily N-acetyltransferase